MSIFSKLLKRGPEDGGEPAVTEKPEMAGKPQAPNKRDGAERAAAPGSMGAPDSPNGSRSGAPVPAAKGAIVRAPAATTAARNGAARPAASSAVVLQPAAKVGKTTVAAPATAQKVATGTSGSPRPSATRPAEPLNGTPAEGNGVPAEAQAASGSIELAFDRMLTSTGVAAVATPAFTASDHQAVLATFEELAVGHSAQVRSLMMEIQWGEAQTSWVELSRPALRSLRTMAGQVEHSPLCAALDGFCAAIDEALRPGAPPAVAGPARDRLLAAYAPLVAALPGAFELTGERDRREPLVVRALLAQVPGLEPLMVNKLLAAGLGRLEGLFQARADEVAAVAGLSADVAAAVVGRVQAWRKATPAALSTPDPSATARELAALVESLEADHLAFEGAARGWTEADRVAKRQLRRRRELTFLQITIALARLGEVDVVLELEKLSFARRIQELARVTARLGVASIPGAGPAPATAPAATPVEPPVRKIERDMPSGAHAAH